MCVCVCVCVCESVCVPLIYVSVQPYMYACFCIMRLEKQRIFACKFMFVWWCKTSHSRSADRLDHVKCLLSDKVSHVKCLSLKCT